MPVAALMFRAGADSGNFVDLAPDAHATVLLAMGRSPGTVLPPPVRELLRHLLECRPDPVTGGGVRTGPSAPTGLGLGRIQPRRPALLAWLEVDGT